MNYKYVSIDRIFAKFIRDVSSSFDEGDLIEWTGEALEFIAAAPYYEEAVAFIEVKNHQCKLPLGLNSVIQIARNTRWGGPKDNSLCPIKVKDTTVTHNTEPTATIPVAIDCKGEPVDAYELAYYRPYFDLRYEYDQWRGSSYYGDRYIPVRLATNTFFNTMVCREVDEHNGRSVYQTDTDEYTIIGGDTLRFSFQHGSVAVSYLRQVLDEETGYPMIPDNISYTTAITKYLTMKTFEKEFYNGREGAQAKMTKAEQDWQWYCKQATNADMMPHGVDEYQNMLDQRSYILPMQNRYNGFFGKMARPEVRKYNDPDVRNWSGQYFRGNGTFV